MMDKASVIWTKGREWWIDIVTMSGRRRYPKTIKVGELDRARLYVPAKIKCPHCGEKIGDDHE